MLNFLRLFCRLFMLPVRTQAQLEAEIRHCHVAREVAVPLAAR